jgi:hypothetical protein
MPVGTNGMRSRFIYFVRASVAVILTPPLADIAYDGEIAGEHDSTVANTIRRFGAGRSYGVDKPPGFAIL